MAQTQQQQAAILIGENHDEIATCLTSEAGNASTKDTLNIINQYYSAKIRLVRFQSVDSFQKNSKKYKDSHVGVIIVLFSNEDDLKKLFSSAEPKCDVQLVVFKNSERLSDDLRKFFVTKYVEHVILEPNEEELSEYSENQETYGVSRIYEALQTADWPVKVMSGRRTNGKNKNVDKSISPSVDRLINLINAIPDSSEDEDAEPNEEDEEAIWAAFSPYMKTAITSENSRKAKIPENDEAEDASTTVTVSVNVAFEKQRPAANAETTSVSEQATSKSKKKRAKKKLAAKLATGLESEIGDKEDEADDKAKETNLDLEAEEKLRDALDTIFDGELKMDSLKEVRSRLDALALDRKQRVDLSAAAALRLTDQMFLEGEEEGIDEKD